MTIPTFDWADFVAPLDPLVLAMMLIIGTAFGVVVGRLMPRAPVTNHGWWLTASAIIFFVPLAVLRGLEGVDSWERLLGTGVTFLVWGAGLSAGVRWVRRRQTE